METSKKAEAIGKQLAGKKTKLGDLRNMAKEIKMDHVLALELWSAKDFLARMLAILIMDKGLLTDKVIENLVSDITRHNDVEQRQLMDWLMANQLMKGKNTIALIESWKDSPSSLKRRTYRYYQARLRWTGKKPADSEKLLAIIEERIENEAPEVQWAMNFTAAWIGVYEKEYRNRCIALGERTGLYKGELVTKGCTPDYLPEFIRTESDKRSL